MPLPFHRDRSAKFDQQYLSAKKHVVPFIETTDDVNRKSVLEIGCGEGGNLKAFLERGCTCLGVDLSAPKITYANRTFRNEIEHGRISFVTSDIYDPEVSRSLHHRFDIVVIRDTLEHIYDHERILRQIGAFLREGGVLFVAFPPWCMPFGGHQQMAHSTLGKLPYYHLLPRSVYRGLLKLYGERADNWTALVDTRISINYFEKLLRRTGYRKLRRQFYLINPIYEQKFGLRAVRQLPLLADLPWIRDFVTTACYYIARPDPGTHDVR